MIEAALPAERNARRHFFIVNDVVLIRKVLLCAALINLLLVAIIGVLLRAFPYLSNFPLSYKNILHGHSHFAFGGWVMPALFALILYAFPELEQKAKPRHWRNIALLTLLSAYGMLVFFSSQGYKAVSIVFSTLSIAAGFYFAVIVWKALRKIRKKESHLFLSAGLVYMVLSSIGPFATGPLIASGKAGSAIYFDAIYFYLHFQYNGWFVFAVLGLFYRWLEEKGICTNGKRVYVLLDAACIPTYFLSILWHQPSIVFNIIGGLAALVQCVTLLYLVKDIFRLQYKNLYIKLLVCTSFSAFAIKTVLQLLSAFPAVAQLAYLQRNFVIAYLHLVLLGFVTLFLFGFVIDLLNVKPSSKLKMGLCIFLFAFVGTESIMIAKPISNMLGFELENYILTLLIFSCLLPMGLCLLSWSCIKKLRFC